jgi:hypothetical protein
MRVNQTVEIVEQAIPEEEFQQNCVPLEETKLPEIEVAKVDLQNPLTQLCYNTEFKLHKESISRLMEKKFYPTNLVSQKASTRVRLSLHHC